MNLLTYPQPLQSQMYLKLSLSSFTSFGHLVTRPKLSFWAPSRPPNNPTVSPFTFLSIQLPLKWILAGCFGVRQAQVQMSSRLGLHFLLHLQPQPSAQSLHLVQCQPLLLRLDRLTAARVSLVWWGCSPWGSQDRTLEPAGLLRALQPVPEDTEVPCGIGQSQSHTHKHLTKSPLFQTLG